MIGALSIHPLGRINFLWVNPKFRNKGIGKGLISHAVGELELKKLTISFLIMLYLWVFLKPLNFTKDSISQYEMYITL